MTNEKPEPPTQPELFAADAPPPVTKKPRGFAGMTREKVRAIASQGGKAAHALGTAHKFTSEEGRAAGRVGGKAAHARRGRQVPPTPETES